MAKCNFCGKRYLSGGPERYTSFHVKTCSQCFEIMKRAVDTEDVTILEQIKTDQTSEKGLRAYGELYEKLRPRTEEELLLEEERKKKEAEERAILIKKHRVKRWIRRIIFLVLAVSLGFGFKTGKLHMPKVVEHYLLGASLEEPVQELTYEKGKKLELLDYNGFKVYTKGITKDEFGKALSIRMSEKDKYEVRLADVKVNGIVIHDFQIYNWVDVCKNENGKIVRSSGKTPITLREDLLRKAFDCNQISMVEFCIELRPYTAPEDASYVYMDTEPLYRSKPILVHFDKDSLDLTEKLGDMKKLYESENVTVYNLYYEDLWKGSGDNLLLIDNHTDYRIRIDAPNAKCDGKVVANERTKMNEDGSYTILSGPVWADDYIPARSVGICTLHVDDEAYLGKVLEIKMNIKSEDGGLFGYEIRGGGKIELTDFFKVKIQ